MHSHGVQFRMFSKMGSVLLAILNGLAMQHLPRSDVALWQTEMFPLWAAFLDDLFGTAADTCTHYVCLSVLYDD